ncbi:hypothetical protein GQR58_024618 [Nymphon striatum]|nr:hypothetical protein GQR58_024618 [Nymphon striatum]
MICTRCYQCTWSKLIRNSIINKTDHTLNKEIMPIFGRNVYDRPMSEKEVNESCQSCPIEYGGACVKWTFFGKENDILNVSRFCFWSPKINQGCFEERVAKQTTKEVCFCDGEYCNKSPKVLLTVSLSMMMILIYILISK